MDDDAQQLVLAGPSPSKTARIIEVARLGLKSAVCECGADMTLNEAEPIPKDGWSWLWWACPDCGAVTREFPLRLKSTRPR